MLFQPKALVVKRLIIQLGVKELVFLALVLAVLLIAAPQGHALAASMPGVQAPATAQSFDIDTSNFLGTAASIFNALWPAFAIIVGITLGLGLLSLIVREIRQAI